MSLTEPTYYAFLLIVTLLLNWHRTQGFRLELLIAFSLAFYATFSVVNVAILCSIIAVAYLGAIGLERLDGNKWQNYALLLLLILVSTPLFLYKYGNNIELIGHIISTGVQFPIGISFYTFLAIGYLVDVSLGLQPAVRNAKRFLAFLTFFPFITSGPIERSRHFLPQLNNLGCYSEKNIVEGFRAILLGVFLKIVISEAIHPIVDQVYSSPELYGPGDIILATLLFAFQVYADFAGYSLIAIGSAKLLGIDLLKNFNQPFLSSTIPEFWRNWHISLSSWVKDYVFSSLQIRLRSMRMWGFAIATLISFIAVGLWHGAGMQFLVFGIIHGAFVVSSTITLPRRDAFWRRVGMPFRIVNVARIISTFLLVAATLVLFRASSWESVIEIYRIVLFSKFSSITLDYYPAILPVAIVISGDVCEKIGMSWSKINKKVRFLIYHCIMTAIIIVYLMNGVFQDSANNQFIYYRF